MARPRRRRRSPSASSRSTANVLASTRGNAAMILRVEAGYQTVGAVDGQSGIGHVAEIGQGVVEARPLPRAAPRLLVAEGRLVAMMAVGDDKTGPCQALPDDLEQVGVGGGPQLRRPLPPSSVTVAAGGSGARPAFQAAVISSPGRS